MNEHRALRTVGLRMAKFKKTSVAINGIKIIEPTVFADDRGFFTETYSKREFEEIGLDTIFVQDNRSHSIKGVLRGLHFQEQHQQAKLVSVVRGMVYDVAVDLRVDFKTYGKYFGLILSEENRLMLFIPKGFAHGFLTLSETADFSYKVSDYYYPQFDAGVIWNDPDIGIDWPLRDFGIDEPILSKKDSNLPKLRELKEQ
jgi:dTDP-4-dehydrorhamnose 3,5-epimerase